MYIRTRGEAGSRRYVEVEIVDSGSGEITILVPDRKLVKRTHTELYHRTEAGSFASQLFQIVKRKKHRAGVMLCLTQVSATKGAEMRKHPRVPTDTIRARFGDEEDCRVIDICEKGIGLVSSEHAEVGASVRVVLHHIGTDYTGTARVQNVRESDSGAFRYGLCCIGSMGDPDELMMALPRIVMQVQLLTPDPVGD